MAVFFRVPVTLSETSPVRLSVIAVIERQVSLAHRIRVALFGRDGLPGPGRLPCASAGEGRAASAATARPPPRAVRRLIRGREVGEFGMGIAPSLT